LPQCGFPLSVENIETASRPPGFHTPRVGPHCICAPDLFLPIVVM
jgi:hypothetical protein